MIEALESWTNCQRCGLCQFRRKVVLGSGPVPARILMIAEAPNKAEDSIGEPFVGPAGRLFRSALKDAMTQAGIHFCPSIFITHTVACRPTDETGLNREPNPDEIRACSERVLMTAEAVSPEVVVLLGEVAGKGCRKHFPRALRLRHPAYVIRCGGTDSSEYVAFVRGLTELLKALNIRTVRKKGVGCGS
jgi:uracil-DNA glycosylase family 4